MLVYAQQFTLDDRTVYVTCCERCSAIVGELDKGEIQAVSTGKYGKVLCFDCEQKSCEVCQNELSERDQKGGQSVCWFCRIMMGRG